MRPDYRLTDNGPQFGPLFFEYICGVLRVKFVSITAYHLETNGQKKRYNKTLESMLRPFSKEHQN